MMTYRGGSRQSACNVIISNDSLPGSRRVSSLGRIVARSAENREARLGLLRLGQGRKRPEPLVQVIDAQFLEMPGYGSRHIAQHLRRQGYTVGREPIRRLMAKMGPQSFHHAGSTSRCRRKRVGIPDSLH
jgi:hypothetical protein